MDSLIVDVYEGDFEGRRMDWAALAAAGDPWRGVILKATQGTYYNGGTWFPGQWRLVQLAGQAGPEPRGIDWIRGAYHYLDVRCGAVAQADHFLATIKRAGGILPRDLLMVDVERASQRAQVTGGQVVDVVSAFVERVKEVTGRGVILYGGSWLHELGITSRMGCRYLAVARYAATLPMSVYQRIGWGRESVLLWQYCGVDGNGQPQSLLQGYPLRAPGCGYVDISAVILPGGTDAWQP